MNKNEIKQRKKLLQNKESLKRQKEDLRNIRKTQNKLNREKSKTKLKHGAREKGDEKMKFSLFSSKKKRKKTVQDSLPYLRMLRDGICQIDVNKFNKTIRFYDINYQLSTEEDKEAIFNQFSDFLNYFDPNVDIQFSYINHIGKNEEVEKNIFIPQRKDAFNEIRQEYTQMLRQQSQKGNRGLSKNMYLTFTLEASDLREGKLRLERMEIDLLNNFKKLGVKAYVLNGYERLKLMHDLLNSEEKFVFSFDDLKHSGLSTKDYIAPPSFNFSKVNEFNIGPYTGEVNFLQILAPELSDRMLAEFLSVEENMVVSFHINSIDQTEAIKMIKRKITDLDKMKIEENKKAIRAGYDMDILPSDLV